MLTFTNQIDINQNEKNVDINKDILKAKARN